MSTFRALWAATLLSCVACQYDFDELYRSSDGGAQSGDGGVADAEVRSSNLIGLWGNYPTVDDECIQCAETACAAAEVDCRADAECVAFTRCIAETPTPAGKIACRARHLDWVTASEFLARDYNGPYGLCVFRDACPRECEGPSDLTCLRNYSWPLTSDTTVPLDLVLNDSQDLKRTLSGVVVKVCPEGDPQCKAPTSMGVTDQKGHIRLDLPTGFNRAFTGFIELQGGEVYPQLLKFSYLVGGPSMQVMTLINKATFDLFDDLLGFEADPSRGILQARMYGCSGMTTRGVKFATTGTDALTKSCYMDNGLPNFAATETDALGSGITFNVPIGIGYQTVTATRASDGEVIARVNAPVRSGFITVVIMEPDAL